MGYTNIKVYRDGILGWAKAGYPLTSSVIYPEVDIPLISSLELSKALKKGKTLIDIRPASHFKKGHIAGAINIDLEDLPDRLDVLPKNKELILIDHKGKLTLTTGRFLRLKGFQIVHRLDGGFNAWAKSGLEVVR